MGGGKSSTQRLSEQITNNDMNTQNAERAQTDATLQQFDGPVQNSGLYHSLVTNGTESTARAYDSAKSNMLQKAKMSGFGYDQPVTTGSMAQMDQSEASDMASVPRQAEIAATDPALKSAAIHAGVIPAFSPNSALNTTAQLQTDRDKANAQAAQTAQQALMTALAFA